MVSILLIPYLTNLTKTVDETNFYSLEETNVSTDTQGEMLLKNFILPDWDISRGNDSIFEVCPRKTPMAPRTLKKQMTDC